MSELSTYVYLLSGCLLVVISYLYNVIAGKTGIPSVLLLLLTGIITREVIQSQQVQVTVPAKLVELFGVLGLLMIVLEAGLDLSVSKKKIRLVRNAFLSAFIIFLLSAASTSLFLFYYLKESLLNCVIYAIPLSVVSSAIVIPSISHLGEQKKEFLVYETSFSDIIGILFFNYVIAGNVFQGSNITWFFSSIVLAIVASIVLSVLMLLMLTRISTRVKYFLVFAILIFLYAGGKLLHLPALFIILLFGLTVSNWQLSIFKRFHKKLTPESVNNVSHLLHSLTNESSFLIRTFFFFVFGLTIDLRLLADIEVLLAGTAIVLLLIAIRYLYLRYFLKAHIFPELFFMPRGLITVLLFYSIPQANHLSRFNEGILFFIILTTAVLMMVGSIAYGKPHLETINDEVPLPESK